MKSFNYQRLNLGRDLLWFSLKRGAFLVRDRSSMVAQRWDLHLRSDALCAEDDHVKFLAFPENNDHVMLMGKISAWDRGNLLPLKTGCYWGRCNNDLPWCKGASYIHLCRVLFAGFCCVICFDMWLLSAGLWAALWFSWCLLCAVFTTLIRLMFLR